MKVSARVAIRFAALALVLVPGVAMAQVKVEENHLKFNGFDYFRGNSENIKLGSYGEKKTPLTKTNYLEVQATLPAGNIGKIQTAMIVEIDYASTKKTDFFANINVGAVFGLSTDAAWEAMKAGKLKLVKLSIDNTHMTGDINNSPTALNRIRDYGADARVANQVFVVMNASTASIVTKSASLEVSASGNGIKLTAGVSGSGTSATSVTLSPGSTFAYGLLMVADWSKGKDKIEKMTDDQWSLN
jgi:hypothetical protein